MTLRQISSWINRALGGKIAAEQIVLLVDAVQRLAMDETSEAFKVFEAMTIYQKVSVGAFAAPPVSGDVGRSFVGAGGAVGVIIAYVNTADERYYVLETEGDFEAGEAFTTEGGVGAGTLAAEDVQAGYVGPYNFPAYEDGLTKVRKFLGVTTFNDAALFGSEAELVPPPSTDYGMLPRTPNLSRFLLPGRPDELRNTFTFATAPARGDSHRWIYWQEAPSITGVGASNDANFLVPARYHFNFVSACVKCGKMLLEGESFTREDIETDLGPWWNSLRRKYTPNGRGRNLSQNARYPRSIV